MNRKRFYRNRYRSHPFSTLLTTATATIVAAVIALVVLSPTAYSRAYPSPHKLSSCATVMPRQTAEVSRHIRSTKTHIITATDSEYSRFTATMHHRRCRQVARLIGSYSSQLYTYFIYYKSISEVPNFIAVRSILQNAYILETNVQIV